MNDCLLTASIVGYIYSCDSLDKLKARCLSLEQEIRDKSRFKDFYHFTFNYAKNPGQKGLGMWDTIKSSAVFYVPTCFKILNFHIIFKKKLVMIFLIN